MSHDASRNGDGVATPPVQRLCLLRGAAPSEMERMMRSHTHTCARPLGRPALGSVADTPPSGPPGAEFLRSTVGSAKARLGRALDIDGTVTILRALGAGRRPSAARRSLEAWAPTPPC